MIERIYSKNQEAFSYMVDAYSKLLWVVVGGILKNMGTTEDIEECISDVFLQVWINPKAYDSKKGTLKNYLAVIARSKALNSLRKLTRADIIGLDENTVSAKDDLLADVMNKQMYQELYTAINSLSEPNKEVVIRRYFYDEKLGQIAKIISISVKEVENRLYQSKLKLRKILK
ncbi:MAG: sigma-70 family RNA polymerase sigma factor [Oscillospiraceae bacterium]|nr:sigma-70 family RNA polymerase sigma factor [Oscillospiraceae bacterium]